MSLAILFHFLCIQHVSDINISIIRSFRLCCWITTSVVLFSFRCVLDTTGNTQTQQHQISNTQRTENKTTDVVIQQHSRKLLMMDILMSETCCAHKNWNKIASVIKLIFYSSTITMMHGPINTSSFSCSNNQNIKIFWMFFQLVSKEKFLSLIALSSICTPLLKSHHRSLICFPSPIPI